MEYSDTELKSMEAGVSVFPHFLGTDSLGRDMSVRIMMGSRISLLVGIVASAIICLIGSLYGAIAGYFGGRLDQVMMRIVDMIYTVPDLIIIILLTTTLKYPLKSLAESNKAFAWINVVGVGLICIFIVFALLYWVGMARIIRSQILSLKEQEYVTAAKALGSGSGRIITKHLLKNCMGMIIVTTTLQIPSAIFTESFLSFIGLGVSAPMPSLGSLADTALDGISSYPYRLLAPAIMTAGPYSDTIPHLAFMLRQRSYHRARHSRTGLYGPPHRITVPDHPASLPVRHCLQSSAIHHRKWRSH